MSQEQWTAVDSYIADLFLKADPVLEEALMDSAAAGLPAIHVSPSQGRLLQLLVSMRGARNILEIGTLGGYSTIWLARGLPADGRLITLEYEPRHAEVACSNIAKAGFSGVVEVRIGNALEILPQLAAEDRDPFDLIFIDADKPGYPDYFSWAMKLSRQGTVIIADNVVRNGAVADAGSTDPLVQGVRRMNELIANEPRVSATTIQTVGAKGYDGLMIAVVTADR
jgi:predicted O-methyltransferase YrrM